MPDFTSPLQKKKSHVFPNPSEILARSKNTDWTISPSENVVNTGEGGGGVDKKWNGPRFSWARLPWIAFDFV